MIDKLYLISQSQIDELLSIDVTAESKALMQSLPMVSGEPVAWLITTELQDGTKHTYAATGKYKHVRDACDFGEPIPLYTSPQPLQPITA